MAAPRRTRRPAAWPVVDAEHGCERRRVRARDPVRTPHAAVWRFLEDRVCRCTTRLRPERAVRPQQCVRTRGALGCARSSRQTVTALGAPRLQHGTASTGAHPKAEAMLLGPAAVIGLVGALHAALLELHSAALTVDEIRMTSRAGLRRQRQNRRQDYGRARPCGNRQRRRRDMKGFRAAPEGRRSEDGRKPASVRRSTMWVVHMMWTMMWILMRDPGGGAGERP